MNKEQRLQFCKACKLQKIDPDKGIICSLTNSPAEFELACTMYREDPELKHQVEMDAIRNQLYRQESDKWKRFLNYIIDSIMMYVMAFVLMVLYILFVGVSDTTALEELANNNFVAYVVGAILTVMYYTFQEALTGRSIGKLLTKTKVIDQNGEKPSISDSFVRSLCRCVPFEAFSFVFAEKGWHDAWTNTKVVDIE